MFSNSLCVIGACIALNSGAALAGSVDFHSDANSTTNAAWTGASLEGTIDYSHTSGSNGVLTFSLTNNSGASVGGFLTGIVFNIGSADANASASLSSASDNDFKDTGAEAANPFGMFDAGAALKANWSGGGKPSKGLGVGASMTLVFDIVASDASSLTAMSFLGDGSDIALRFRGLNNDASDKLQGTLNDPSLTVVPLPAPVLAGGAMLGLGLGVRGLRNRK